MEPANQEGARKLNRPDVITTIAVIVIVLILNGVMLVILF